MKLGKVVRSTVLAAGVVAANLAVFAGSAMAGDRYYGQYNGHNRGRSYQAAPYHGHGNHYGYKHKKHNNGAAVAIGLGALILGTMIASEANRHRGYDRHDRDVD